MGDAMTAALVRAGLVAIALDLAAFMAWIVPGRAAETNPLIVGIDPLSAVLAKLALLALVASLGFIAERADDRKLTLVVRVVGAVAIAAGVLGFGSTLASI